MRFMKATETVNINSNYTVTVGPFVTILAYGSMPLLTVAGVFLRNEEI